MRIHLSLSETVWRRRQSVGGGWQRSRNSSWHLAAFSLCFLLIIQQCVTLTLPPQRTIPSVAMEEQQEEEAASSLALISSPQLNEVSASVSLLPPLALKMPPSGRTNVLTPGQMVINAVPKNDRETFFNYQLAKGLRNNTALEIKTHWLRNLQDVIDFTEEQNPFLEDVPIYENFPTDLLSWLMEKFNLLPEEIFNQLRSRSKLWCTASGVCYTSDDVVCYCCPF